MPGVWPNAQPSGDDITIATAVENDPLAPFNCDYSIESIGSTRMMFTPTFFQNPA